MAVKGLILKVQQLYHFSVKTASKSFILTQQRCDMKDTDCEEKRTMSNSLLMNH